MIPPYLVSISIGLIVFAIGMVTWSEYRQDWHDAAGFGLAAGGLVLLIVGLASAPGWS